MPQSHGAPGSWLPSHFLSNPSRCPVYSGCQCHGATESRAVRDHYSLGCHWQCSSGSPNFASRTPLWLGQVSEPEVQLASLVSIAGW